MSINRILGRTRLRGRALRPRLDYFHVLHMRSIYKIERKYVGGGVQKSFKDRPQAGLNYLKRNLKKRSRYEPPQPAGRHGKHRHTPTLTGPLYPQQLGIGEIDIG